METEGHVYSIPFSTPHCIEIPTPITSTFFSLHLISFNVRDIRNHGELVGNAGKTQSNSNSTTTPPRSPVVTLQHLSQFSAKILEIIRDCKSVTNNEICIKMGKGNNYVKQYLYRLKKYGFIFRNDDTWKWSLCDLDNGFFVELDHILYLKYNGNTKVTEEEHNGNTGNVLPQVLPINNKPEIKGKPKQKPIKTVQVNLVTLLQKIMVEQAEREVVDMLVSEIENDIILTLANWYDKTQLEAKARAYKHYSGPDEFANALGYGLADIRHALSNLEDKGWIWTVPPSQDKYGRWKIGFTEEFLEKVRNR